jgi:hypothetical protein
MRRMVTVGALAVVSSLGGACVDDGEPGPGNGGNGGTAGRVAAAGTSGVGGASGVGGTAGTGGGAGTAAAGTAGNAGNGDEPDAGDGGPGDVLGDAGDAEGTPPPCTGCIELRASVSGAPEDSNSAYFRVTLAAQDTSDTVARFRMRAPVLFEGSPGPSVHLASRDAELYNGRYFQIDAATFGDTESFVDIDLNIGADLVSLSIEVTSAWGAADVVLLLDSITFVPAGTPEDLHFTDDAQGFAVGSLDFGATAEIIHH